MLQLILGLLLFALSLLAVVQPPSRLMWLLSVPVKEWGYLLALGSAGVAYWGWAAGSGTWLASVGGLLAPGAALLFLMPLLTALPVVLRLRRELAAAFGEGPALPGGGRVVEEALTYSAELKLHLYRPAALAGGAAPVVIDLHGGSWRSGSPTEFARFHRYLARQGFWVASAQYRLVPEARFPAQLEDVRAAIAFVKAHAARLGADASRIVLLGRSAGAQLAVLAAYTAGDPAIKGAVSIYGPFDLAWGYSLPGWILDSKGILEGYLGGPPAEAADAYAAANPIGHVGPETPPTLLIQGLADVLVAPRHSDLLSERLREAGRPVHYVKVPLGTHGSDFLPGGPVDWITKEAVVRFLRAVLKG